MSKSHNVKKMIVWEVLLGDAVDATEKDRVHGGIMVHNLPVRHTCYIESDDQTGLGDEIKEAAIIEGLSAGLVYPMVKGCIRASKPVADHSEAIYRALQGRAGT